MHNYMCLHINVPSLCLTLLLYCFYFNIHFHLLNVVKDPFTSAITIVHYALCIVHYYALFVAHCVHRFDGHCTGSRCKTCQHAEDTQ